MTRMKIVGSLMAGLLALGVAAPAQEVSAKDRRNARQEFEKGEEQMRKEDVERAVVHFRKATTLDPAFVVAHYSLGQALMLLKQYPDALAAYEACQQAMTREASLDERGRAEADRQRRDEIRDLQDSLQRLRSGQIKNASPGTDVRIEQRIRLLEQADLKGAENQLRPPAELSLAKGSAHFRLGHMDQAEEAYRAAVAADATLGAAHNNLAVIYMLTGRFDDARAAVARAEQAGFPVSPKFKQDLEARAASAQAK